VRDRGHRRGIDGRSATADRLRRQGERVCLPARRGPSGGPPGHLATGWLARPRRRAPRIGTDSRVHGALPVGDLRRQAGRAGDRVRPGTAWIPGRPGRVDRPHGGPRVRRARADPGLRAVHHPVPGGGARR
jgi:hypothetical protein